MSHDVPTRAAARHRFDRRRLLTLSPIAAIAAIAVIPGLAPRRTRAQAASPPVLLVSTPIFADLLRQVTSDAADVRSVIPTGADPHTYEASAADLARFSDAVAFIEMGAHLEPFVEAGAWRRAVLDAGIPHLVLADHLPLIARDLVIDHGDHVHDLRAGDPHVWLDPQLVREVIAVLRAFVAPLLPAATDQLAANAAAYDAQLVALDADLAASLATIPAARRQLVVFHDAFTYFAARYDFTVLGVVLPNPEGEASAQHLAALVETIATAQVPAIFTEPQFDRRLVDQVAAEAGVEVGVLLTDTFTDEVSTYLALMTFNRDSLLAHLG